ncbi:MAG: hypothetical protein GXP25_24325 [Planctomycetes bacterium]|nr:hypothetical protein [Planctomycetota bacterium]
MNRRRQVAPCGPAWALIALLFLYGLIFPTKSDAQVIRGVCLDSDAPKGLVVQAAEAGLNTVIVHFDEFGGAADDAALKSMREWAEAAAQAKMCCYVAIRAFGPLSCLGLDEMRWRTCRNLFGTSLPMVCPVDRGYWRDVVAAHVEAVGRLAQDVPIHGVLLSLYRNWTTQRHSFDSCFCDSCVGEFFDADDYDHDEEAVYLRTRSCAEKLALMRRELTLAPYHERQADAVGRTVRNEIGCNSSLPRDFAVGLFDCGDTWLDRAVISGVIRNDKPVLVGMDFGERACMVDLAGTCKARWAYAKLRTRPIVYLDTRYFLPEDVAHEVALLKDRDIPFALTHTRGWWRRGKGDGGTSPPLGTAEAYFKAVKGGFPAGSVRKFFAGRERHPLIPRVALIHGQKWSWAACKIVAGKLKNLDIYPDLFPAWGAESLERALGYYDVLVLAPGYEKTDRDFFAKIAGDLGAYLRNGGVLSVLGADGNGKLAFLRDIDSQNALRVRSDLGSHEGKLNRNESVVLGPFPVKGTVRGKSYFSGFEGKYTSLVSRDNGGSYLVKKDVGRGMLVVTPETAIPFEFVANLWVQHKSQNESLVIRIMSGSRYLRMGENRLRVGVGDQRLEGETLLVQMDVISPAGERVASTSAECFSASEGAEIPLEFEAQAAGRHLLVVTVSDPDSKFVLGRRIIPLDVPPPIRVELEKDYYTTEEETTVRVLCDPVLCSPDEVKLVLEGSAPVPCELIQADMDHALFRVPLGKASPGMLRLIASAGDVSATKAFVKRKPKEGEVKIIGGKALSFLNDLLLPIGSFGFDPATGKDLVQAGLRVAVSSASDIGPIREAGVQVVAEPSSDRREKSGDYLAWNIGEEVDHANLSPRDVRARYRDTKEKDPYRPVAAGVNGDLSMNFCSAYAPACDAFFISSYPLPFYRIDSVGEAVRRAVEANRGKRPVWLICQCFDWRDVLGIAEGGDVERSPAERELRNMVYQGLTSGASGVLFWRYGELVAHPKLRKSLEKVLGEIKTLKPIFMGPDSRQQVVLRPPASPVLYRLLDHEGKTYLLACNPTAQVQAAEFELPFTIRSAAPLGQDLETVGSILDVELDPLDAKVYVLSP